MMKNKPKHSRAGTSGSESGVTLVELMIAITISLLVMLALTTVYLNVSRTNSEMARTTSQIENGRYAIQLLQKDLAHAGFWGAYVPQFDNLTLTTVPTDVPNAVPDPCLAFNPANWTTAHKSNLIGIPVQTVPAGNCVGLLTNQRDNTDILVVRHAANCLTGSSAAAGDCEAIDANKLYFQSSLCSAAAQLGSSATTIRLAPTSSSANDFYVGKTIRLLSGTGAGQAKTVTAYNGTTKVATVDSAWGTTPDASTNYTFDNVDYVLDTTGHTLLKKDCSTTADIRKFISRIYYIRNYATSTSDGIPTLWVSQFDTDAASGAPGHGTPVPLVEGIEGFRIEYGIDDRSKTGAQVNDAAYAAAVTWLDPTDQRTVVNRGDGNVDGPFVRCPREDTTAINTATATAPAANACTVAQLRNVVAVKIYVLARSREATPGYVDNKTYTLGSTTMGPFNDGFKRHVFSTTVRLTNVSGRRETP